MQLSKVRLNRNLEKQIKEMLFGALAEISSPAKVEEVLNDLLTEAEKTAMMKRLGIAVYLDKGRNYEDIKNNLKVSSATIAMVAESLGNSGFQEMIRRIKAEQWATEWSKKISQNLKRWLPV
jgi:uncharacterized protein YerC